ncbi:hypothetical protein MJO28_012726 [Puccinia striiformis f. sp. tritici]|uniref:Uncharacterized protein n=1 Tax=Puccinia striiformis f. sp. tritici TaxID=168172 RepID=A0ACC0E0P9_9BASI|nr:hypothetical protein MJO28_012726 [Puccinia striiformis f. sp. tritici]KAI7945319.1 hypothetical protein MJO29_011707 [Puccinia striiformis f. sp. tritici]
MACSQEVLAVKDLEDFAQESGSDVIKKEFSPQDNSSTRNTLVSKGDYSAHQEKDQVYEWSPEMGPLMEYTHLYKVGPGEIDEVTWYGTPWKISHPVGQEYTLLSHHELSKNSESYGYTSSGVTQIIQYCESQPTGKIISTGGAMDSTLVNEPLTKNVHVKPYIGEFLIPKLASSNRAAQRREKGIEMTQSIAGGTSVLESAWNIEVPIVNRGQLVETATSILMAFYALHHRMVSVALAVPLAETPLGDTAIAIAGYGRRCRRSVERSSEIKEVLAAKDIENSAQETVNYPPKTENLETDFCSKTDDPK